MIDITVNSKKHSVQENISVVTLLEDLIVSSDGIAIAINQEIISREDWQTTTVKNSDTILIIQATQGG